MSPVRFRSPAPSVRQLPAVQIFSKTTNSLRLRLAIVVGSGTDHQHGHGVLVLHLPSRGMLKQIDKFRAGVKEHATDAVAVEDGESLSHVGCIQLVEEYALVLKDICSAIKQNGNLANVPDEVASPFVTVQHVPVHAVTIQVRQGGGGE